METTEIIDLTGASTPSPLPPPLQHSRDVGPTFLSSSRGLTASPSQALSRSTHNIDYLPQPDPAQVHRLIQQADNAFLKGAIEELCKCSPSLSRAIVRSLAPNSDFARHTLLLNSLRSQPSVPRNQRPGPTTASPNRPSRISMVPKAVCTENNVVKSTTSKGTMEADAPLPQLNLEKENIMTAFEPHVLPLLQRDRVSQSDVDSMCRKRKHAESGRSSPISFNTSYHDSPSQLQSDSETSWTGMKRKKCVDPALVSNTAQ